MAIELTYDSLPAGSRLRREVNPDGSITISISAGEMNAIARRSALRDTSIFSACGTALFATITWLVIDVNVSNRWPGNRWVAPLLWISMGIFFGALFLLIWKSLFNRRQEILERAANQTTVMNISSRGLIVETSGPMGTRSVTIDTAEVAWGYGRSRVASIDCFRIERNGGDVILFPALSVRELDWITGEVSRVIRRPQT